MVMHRQPPIDAGRMEPMQTRTNDRMILKVMMFIIISYSDLRMSPTWKVSRQMLQGVGSDDEQVHVGRVRSREGSLLRGLLVNVSRSCS